jgi:hypothetical protein
MKLTYCFLREIGIRIGRLKFSIRTGGIQWSTKVKDEGVPDKGVLADPSSGT